MESVLRPIVGLDDAFGQRTRQLRRLQSKLMDIFYQSEYEEVIPPLLERPESLSTGAGKFLAGQTIMFSDPAGEGLLAIRPDMTPQMARIAATRLRDLAVPRLCYSGQVMVARPDSLSGSRQQWQTGIELLGIAGEEADMEVMHLAALCLHVVNFNNPVIQVGHTGLLKALVADSDISLNSWASVLRLRSPEDMQQKLAHTSLPAASKQALMDMASGLADEDWIRQIRANLPVGFQKASAQLLELVGHVKRRLEGEVSVQLDAAVVPRFFYHNGIVFSAFSESAPQALLYGGRYDSLMAQHGRDMPATGFSCDLWAWLDAGAMPPES